MNLSLIRVPCQEGLCWGSLGKEKELSHRFSPLISCLTAPAPFYPQLSPMQPRICERLWRWDKKFTEVVGSNAGSNGRKGV